MTASADDITALDATALSEAVHARRVSCREVMQAYLARIARLNPTYNAIVSLRPDDALLAEADACDAQLARGASRGWLHGVPQAIKDLANGTGLPTTLGSPLMRDFIAREDGLMTARMKGAGCIVIGMSPSQGTCRCGRAGRVGQPAGHRRPHGPQRARRRAAVADAGRLVAKYSSFNSWWRRSDKRWRHF